MSNIIFFYLKTNTYFLSDRYILNLTNNNIIVVLNISSLFICDIYGGSNQKLVFK
jgi:hypothetical protein